MDIPADRLVGTTLSHDRYRVIAKLGEGGMGHVYRAHDRNLDTEVVVKMPRRSMIDDPDFCERFALEVRALVHLYHPHIVRVTDVGEHDDLPFAVMQFLSGGSLEDRHGLGEEGMARPASPSSLASWLPSVAEALDFAHKMGYVHRDVKPPNILFDTQGYAFLGDFGVAKFLSALTEGPARRMATGTGMILGTPGYMSPEVILGEVPHGRTDQYGLAVTVFEVLCGHRPFVAPSPTAVLVQQTTRDAPRMDAVRPGTSAALAEVVGRGLQREPQARYADCASFAKAAIAAAVEAGPPSRTATTVAVAARRRLGLICPICNTGLNVFADLQGKRLRCPSCATKLVVSEDLKSLVPVPGQDGTTTEMPGLQPAPTPVLNAVGTGRAADGGTLRFTAPISPESRAKPASQSDPSSQADPLASLILTHPSESPSPRIGEGKSLDRRQLGIGAAASVVVLGAFGMYLKPKAEPPTPPTLPRSVIAGPIGRSAPAPEKPEPPLPARLTVEQKFLEPALSAIEKGHLEEALKMLDAYLLDADAVRPEQAETLRDAIRTARDTNEARRLLAELSDEDLNEFADGGDWPGSFEEPAPSILDLRIRTLRGLVSSVHRERLEAAKGPKAPQVPLPVASDEPIEVDFKEVWDNPEMFEGRRVVPEEYLLVGTIVTEVDRGKPTLPVANRDRLRMPSGEQTAKDGIVFLLDPGVAERLVQEVNKNPDIRTIVPTYETILTLEIRRVEFKDGWRWAATIVEMEILVAVNKFNVFRGKINEAFRVLKISPEKITKGIGDGDEWVKRKGKKWLDLVKKTIERQLHSAKTDRDRAELDKQLTSMWQNQMKLKDQLDRDFQQRIERSKSGKF